MKFSKVLNDDIFNEKTLKQLKKKFDIIFIDPPYKEKRIRELIEKITELNLLKKEGILIIHRHKKEKDLLPKRFKILQNKTYGISKVIFGT
jgi:16S rRNA (guanine966-N2)-methyltransferase